MSSDDEGVPNFDALCEACEEGRQTLDHQIASLERIDEKALRGSGRTFSSSASSSPVSRSSPKAI